ncbi:hypothetical protein A2U01_0047933, partial [Trifolium medium]|nr:hypothetical protein [Trifolium medium]
RINSFLNKGKFDVCLLQETKKTGVEDYLIHRLWGNQDVRWKAQDAVGLSGGGEGG